MVDDDWQCGQFMAALLIAQNRAREPIRWGRSRQAALRSDRTSAATVVNGPARLVAWVVSRLAPLEAADLASVDRTRWLALRADIKARRLQRTRGSRFRRGPQAYLRSL